MSESTAERAVVRGERGALSAAVAGLPKWSVVSVAVAAGLLAVGLLLAFVEPEPEPRPVAGPAPGTAAATSLVPGETTGEPAAAEPEPQWSPGLFRLGFGFFAGFAVGFALRSFLKLALLFLGLLFLALAGLEEFGLVTVNWQELDGLWDGFAARIEQDFEHFVTVLTGRLPQTALGALGLVAGFKRR